MLPIETLLGRDGYLTVSMESLLFCLAALGLLPLLERALLGTGDLPRGSGAGAGVGSCAAAPGAEEDAVSVDGGRTGVFGSDGGSSKPDFQGTLDLARGLA